MDANQPKPRRWFRFSLRTMFVLVTVAALFAWFLRAPRLEIIGEIDPVDVAAILKTVPQYPEDTRIPLLQMERLAFNRVQLSGHNENGGHSIEFEKYNGKWIVLTDHFGK